MTGQRADGAARVTRREFCAIGAVALVTLRGWAQARRAAAPQGQGPDSLPGTGPAGRLWDPVRAGRPLPPVTAADNDAAIQVIEKQLHCTCGCNLDVYTCRTTDFTCTVSPAMHQRVLALAQAGRTGPDIIAQFVRENGLTILMAPPKHGFNLAGYFVPSLLILVAGAVLALVLRRWTRTAARAPSTVLPNAGTAATPEELERLRRELDRLPA
jgi:cytochrome c-type biogenesis protein CcmH